MTQPELTKSARRHAAIRSRIKLYGRRPSEEEVKQQTKVIGLIILLYFLIGTIINMIDPQYLVAAWLCAGALGLAIYFTRSSKRSAVNVYTVLFGICAVGFVAGFVLSRDWLI